MRGGLETITNTRMNYTPDSDMLLLKLLENDSQKCILTKIMSKVAFHRIF